MTLTPQGRVGIGTTSPATALHIEQGNGLGLVLFDTDGISDSKVWRITGSPSGGKLSFQAADDTGTVWERNFMQFNDLTGEVCIGSGCI